MQKQLVMFQEEVDRGTYFDGGKMTFNEFIQKWLADYAENQLQPKTLFRYKEMLNLRIIPALGHIKLDKLQPTHLLEFYNNPSENGIRLDYKYKLNPELATLLKDVDSIAAKSGVDKRTVAKIISGGSTTTTVVRKITESLEMKIEKLFQPLDEEKGLSSRTILHHHRLISSILTSAVHWQLIFSNPTERVKPPKIEKQEAKHYDEDQTGRMLELLEQEPIKYIAMITLVVFSGMRLGELTGLTWDDIDFQNGYL